MGYLDDCDINDDDIKVECDVEVDFFLFVELEGWKDGDWKSYYYEICCDIDGLMLCLVFYLLIVYNI